jgi:hypothetical protein
MAARRYFKPVTAIACQRAGIAGGDGSYSLVRFLVGTLAALVTVILAKARIQRTM